MKFPFKVLFPHSERPDREQIPIRAFMNSVQPLRRPGIRRPDEAVKADVLRNQAPGTGFRTYRTPNRTKQYRSFQMSMPGGSAQPGTFEKVDGPTK